MGSKLIDRLDAEWEWLSHSRKGSRALRRWAEHDDELGEFRDLADLVRFVHRRDRACEADRILYRLVCRSLTDDLAARTVLACMMPGVKNLTCGYLWAHADADESAAAVLAAMWERIRTYPCERRPAKIAANIQLDTRQRISRRATRFARELLANGDERSVELCRVNDRPRPAAPRRAGG